MFLINICLISFTDCLDVQMAGYDRSGVYDIAFGEDIVSVYCDMETDDGGWTVSGVYSIMFVYCDMVITEGGQCVVT